MNVSIANLLFAFTMISSAAFAASVIQFDASNPQSIDQANGKITAWHSYRRSEQLFPCHSGNSGWQLPYYTQHSISFTDTLGVATPLAFNSSAISEVSRIAVIAKGESVESLSTLIDAPCPLRIVSFTEFDDSRTFTTSGVLSSLLLKIDNIESHTYSEGLHLYEIVFDEPCRLNEIFIGGSPATPAWNRSWTGSICEVDFILGTPSSFETDALRDYISKKWQLTSYKLTGNDSYSTITDLGLRPGNVYSTMIILR